MPKPGTTENVTTETFTEDGRRMKKTTTVTTTVTKTPDGGYKTATSTRTQTEQLPDDDSGAKGGKGKLSDKMKKLNVSDSDDDKDHDGVNEMSHRDTKNFRSDITHKINELRRKHQASGLKTDYDLEKIAQDHAQKMLRKNGITLLSGDYGQTLAMKLPRPSGENIADTWYKGKDEYDFKKAEFNQDSGNFSQMVWCDSKEIGVGVASNKAGKTYIIALYKPPGNVKGRFKDNVKK